MTSYDTVFPLQSSLSFGAPQPDFSMDFLFLRRDRKPQCHHVMFGEERLQCPVDTGMMSPFTHSPNTEPVLLAQLQSNWLMGNLLNTVTLKIFTGQNAPYTLSL